MCRFGEQANSTESLSDTTAIAKVTAGNDIPANLLTSIKLVDTAALDTQLTTLAGNPVVFAREAGTGDLVGKDGSHGSDPDPHHRGEPEQCGNRGGELHLFDDASQPVGMRRWTARRATTARTARC